MLCCKTNCNSASSARKVPEPQKFQNPKSSRTPKVVKKEKGKDLRGRFFPFLWCRWVYKPNSVLQTDAVCVARLAAGLTARLAAGFTACLAACLLRAT